MISLSAYIKLLLMPGRSFIEIAATKARTLQRLEKASR
jgi:hypothetical protein